MAQIITEPETSHVIHHVNETDNSSGPWVALVGIAFIAIVALLFFYFALPLLNSKTITPSTPQVNVPGKIDVNVNKSQ